MKTRLSIVVTGIVQGVGFRPFAHSLATGLGLVGFVRNEAGSVRIEVEGDEEKLEHFREALQRDAPPRARMASVTVSRMPCEGEIEHETDFRIEPSEELAEGAIFVSPDAATCADCLQELADRRQRRFLYPFLNCTQCGPRLTIVRKAPYDRSRTTMRAFPLCPDCRREYENPSDRRFHAEPIACAACGPRLAFLPEGDGDPLERAARLIEAGGIVAIKGIGGYHLACDATREETVAELRRRKRRDEKPFAVMIRDLAEVSRHCAVSDREAAELGSPAAPIVLLRALKQGGIAPSVSRGSPWLGVVLPYSGLHHLLLRRLARPLVMTSGNPASEAIASRDDDAAKRLGEIADGFLVHDREIVARCDDSVLRVPATGEGAPIFFRRSRGYAPAPIALAHPAEFPVLAVGAQLKNTFALVNGPHAFLSQHLGDLDEASVFRAYREEIDRYENLLSCNPSVIAHDLHPDYLSTAYARERSQAEELPLIAVQHHHAHMASCMADNGLSGEVIGVCFDGTGMGYDGTLWGGEFLVGDYAKFRRAACLSPVPLPGGEAAIREPWRMALSHLLSSGIDPSEHLAEIPGDAVRVARSQLLRGVNAPLTSSVGRLFDAVAVLSGAWESARGVSYEGQAAIELEWLASRASLADRYGDEGEFEITGGEFPLLVSPARCLARILSGRRDGVPGPVIATRFHRSLAAMVASVCERIRSKTGLERVVLSGGVFQNALLLEATLESLERSGFAAYRHRVVPANDGGIALGQAAVAAARLGQ